MSLHLESTPIPIDDLNIVVGPHGQQAPEEDTASQSPDYSLLTGHLRNDNTYKTDEQLRTEYINLTDNLVYQMTHGVTVRNPQTGEFETKVPDAVVWLDKSARPLQWLTKELWPKLAQEADGTIPPMPQSYFVNIDKDDWKETLDPEDVGVTNIDNVPKARIQELRSIFVRPQDKKDTVTGEDTLSWVDDADTALDDKVVLIVDEVLSSGQTLRFAEKLLSRAFPDTQFAHAYWMSKTVINQGISMNKDLPVWYKTKEVEGRGVGNVHVAASQQSESVTQRLGAAFLSAALDGPDMKARKLRQEFKQLAHDDQVLVQPSGLRSEEDQDERATRLNGMEASEVYAKLRTQRAQDIPVLKKH